MLGVQVQEVVESATEDPRWDGSTALQSGFAASYRSGTIPIHCAAGNEPS